MESNNGACKVRLSAMGKSGHSARALKLLRLVGSSSCLLASLLSAAGCDRGGNEAPATMVTTANLPTTTTTQRQLQSYSEQRAYIAALIAKNQAAGNVETLIEQNTFPLEGTISQVSTREGSAGFWSFRLDTKTDKYVFLCSSSTELYLRIGKKDVGWEDWGTLTRQSSPEAVVYIRTEDYDFIQRCVRGDKCDGSICPRAIVIKMPW